MGASQDSVRGSPRGMGKCGMENMGAGLRSETRRGARDAMDGCLWDGARGGAASSRRGRDWCGGALSSVPNGELVTLLAECSARRYVRPRTGPWVGAPSGPTPIVNSRGVLVAPSTWPVTGSLLGVLLLRHLNLHQDWFPLVKVDIKPILLSHFNQGST